MPTVEATLRLRIGAYLQDLAQGRAATRGFFRDVERDARQAGERTSAEMGRIGGQAGRNFGDQFFRDAQGRIRHVSGRFASEGEKAGLGFGNSFNRAAKSRIGSGLTGAVSALTPNVNPRGLFVLAAGATAATGALQGIPPVLGAIGGGLAALPGLAAGAMGALGTLSLGSFGLGDAISEVFNPRPGGGGGGGGGGINQTAGALRRLEQAERQLTRAQSDARDAQRELNEAREDARRNLRDMAVQLAGLRLDERSATLAVADAEAELARAREAAQYNPNPETQRDLERSQIAYEQAQVTLTDTRNRLDDLTKDQAKAAKAGVEGSDEVRSALKRQQAAYDAVKDAQYGVLDAQDALNAAMAGGGGGGGGGAATAYSKLSKEAKKFVDQIRILRPELVGIQQLAQDRMLAGLDRELAQTAEVALPFARQQVIRFGDTWNDTFRSAFEVARDPQFLVGLDAALGASDRFFDGVNDRIKPTSRMLSQLFVGSAPFIDRFGESLLSYIDDFNGFVDRAAADGRLERFFADAAEQADALLDIGKEVLVLVGRIGGMNQGSTLLRDMATALQDFNDEAHRMESVERIVETGQVAVRGLVDVLLILGESLGESLADPATRDAVVMFFDVLRVGAEIITDLASLFRMLPDPIQSVVLAAAGLALVAGRLFGSLDKMRGGVSKAAESLGSLGPAGERAGKGLQTASVWAGRAATAFVVLSAADAVFKSFTDDSADVDKLTKSLQQMTEGCLTTGEVLRVFGGDVKFTEGRLQGLNAAVELTGGRVQTFIGNTLASIPLLGPLADKIIEKGLGQSFLSAREDLHALDSALIQTVQTGGVAMAERQLKILAAQAGVSVDELKARLPGYAKAVEEAATGAGTMARRQQLLNGTLEDGIALTGSYANVWKELNGVQLSADQAALAAAESIERVGEAFEQNGLKVDGNSQAALRNRIAVGEAAEEGARLAQQKYEETGSVDAATAAYNQHINALVKEMRQAGLTDDQIRILIGRYTNLPPLTLRDNLGSVRTRAQTIEDELRELTKREWRIDVIQNYRTFGRPINPTTRYVTGLRWGGVIENADGGVYEHAAIGRLRDAHIASPVATARYAYAERATGGEAFVPKFGDRRRSVGILSHAAGWYGMEVVPKVGSERYGRSMSAAGDYGRPAPRGSAAAGGGIDYERLGAAVARHLAPGFASVAASGGGETVVQVDGVEIARASRSGERDLGRRS